MKLLPAVDNMLRLYELLNAGPWKTSGYDGSITESSPFVVKKVFIFIQFDLLEIPEINRIWRTAPATREY